MALNLFFVKDKEVWVRGYGKDGADISLFDLSRDLTRWNCPYVDLDISDDSFSMMMAEWLWEDVESFEHVLALLYQAAWVCAELRERLKAYEDTGLTPERCAEFARADAEGRYIVMRDAEQESVARLRELAKADKDGRVIVLPCKVGDTVYFVNAKQILEFAVVGYAVDETGISWVYSEHVDKTGHTNERTFSPDRISKTTFLTREEAEKALAEMEGK
jgi:hypothetical protein